MKNIKSLVVIFLVAAVLFTGGCSKAAVLNSKESSSNEDSAVEKTADESLGLIKINNVFDENAYPVSVDICGDNILILSGNNNSNLYSSYKLVLYNAKKDKIISQKSFTDSEQMEINEAAFYGQDQVLLIDLNREKAITFDFDFNKTGEIEYKYDSPETLQKKANKSPFVNGRFGYYDEYTVDYEEDMNICVFYDEPDYAYVDKTKNDQIIDSSGKKVLCLKYNENSNRLAFFVNDYENAVCMNKAETEPVAEDNYINPSAYAMSDKYVCVICEYSNANSEGSPDGSFYNIPYIWKYTSDEKNTPIDVQKMNEDDFNYANTQLISDIKNKYSIHVCVDKEIDYTEYQITYGVKPFELYLLLTQLNKALADFPDNFFVEMYSDLNGDYDFNINVVKNIDSSVDAFAYAFECFDITVCTDRFYKNLVYHEMMHLIYERINRYYNDKGESFYEAWEKLNNGIEYDPDAYEVNDEYFVSLYAMKNADEDMADTFGYLCEANEYDEIPDWLKHEHVKKKAVFLCKTIREVFPSVSSSERVFWEKYINYNSK